jgi:hypothetical protein
MAASSNLIADMGTVITNGPSTTTKANAIAAAGPIFDYAGTCSLVLTKFQEASILLAASGAGTYPKGILETTDSGTDGTNLGLLQAVQAALKGLTAPSITLLAALNTVITNGQSTTTTANAIAAGGPLIDYLGCVKLVLLRLQEAHQLLSSGAGGNQTALGLINITDSGTDGTNKTLLQNIQLALA